MDISRRTQLAIAVVVVLVIGGTVYIRVADYRLGDPDVSVNPDAPPQEVIDQSRTYIQTVDHREQHTHMVFVTGEGYNGTERQWNGPIRVTVQPSRARAAVYPLWFDGNQSDLRRGYATDSTLWVKGIYKRQGTGGFDWYEPDDSFNWRELTEATLYLSPNTDWSRVVANESTHVFMTTDIPNREGENETLRVYIDAETGQPQRIVAEYTYRTPNDSITARQFRDTITFSHYGNATVTRPSALPTWPWSVKEFLWDVYRYDSGLSLPAVDAYEEGWGHRP